MVGTANCAARLRRNRGGVDLEHRAPRPDPGSPSPIHGPEPQVVTRSGLAPRMSNHGWTPMDTDEETMAWCSRGWQPRTMVWVGRLKAVPKATDLNRRFLRWRRGRPKGIRPFQTTGTNRRGGTGRTGRTNMPFRSFPPCGSSSNSARFELFRGQSHLWPQPRAKGAETGGPLASSAPVSGWRRGRSRGRPSPARPPRPQGLRA